MSEGGLVKKKRVDGSTSKKKKKKKSRRELDYTYSKYGVYIFFFKGIRLYDVVMSL